MFLVPGVYEDLTLSLRELPEPYYALSWRDLIPVGLADLHSSKR